MTNDDSQTKELATVEASIPKKSKEILLLNQLIRRYQTDVLPRTPPQKVFCQPWAVAAGAGRGL